MAQVNYPPGIDAFDNLVLGGYPSKGNHDADDEAEYSRLRNLAKQEAEARGRAFEASQRAFAQGDKASAKELSEKGKMHDRTVMDYNKRAADFIFCANNATLGSDEIDLHGL